MPVHNEVVLGAARRAWRLQVELQARGTGASIAGRTVGLPREAQRSIKYRCWRCIEEYMFTGKKRDSPIKSKERNKMLRIKWISPLIAIDRLASSCGIVR
jgi:hypothetical protein